MSGTCVDITHRALAALALLALGATMALVGILGAASTASADSHGNGNGRGATQSGPFDPHDVGGGDKQGHGNAPANGTVGNADGKNPPGQLKNNKNRGYECADNKGVGDKGGNPAHSGCSTGGAQGATCPPGSDKPGQALPDGEVADIYCNIEAAPTESTRPNPSGGGGNGGDPSDIGVKGIEANAPQAAGVAAGDAPLAAPTAVAAGTTGEAPSNSSTLWILTGAMLALMGLVLGLSPAPRGKRAI